MSIERVAGGNASMADVLDRVLDKGIVIDAWIRISLVGLDLITVETRAVVASIATYREKWGELAQASTLPNSARATMRSARLKLLEAARQRAAVAVEGSRGARPSSRA